MTVWFSVDEGDAARIDAVRGSVPRGLWLERAVLAVLEAGGGLAALADEGAAVRLAEAREGVAALAERLTGALELPPARRCPHGVRARYCRRCLWLVDVDGYEVRLP